MNKLYTNGVAPLRVKPNKNAPLIMNIPERSVLTSSGEPENDFIRVSYTIERQTVAGWVYKGWLEEYQENYAHDCVDIPDQTADPRDAEQYFMLNGIKQTNICGEACAAYILQLPLKEILEKWQRAKPTIWKSVFGLSKLRGTGYGELITIFETFDKRAFSLSDKLTDPMIARPRYTVTGLRALLNMGYVIAGVNIDNAGRLKPSGTPHWVVIDDVQPERAGYGLIYIYNPYPNRTEVYSWNEFTLSARVPTGVYIPSL